MAFLVLLALIVVAGLWAVGIYNGLVTGRNGYKNAFDSDASRNTVSAVTGSLLPALVTP